MTWASALIIAMVGALLALVVGLYRRHRSQGAATSHQETGPSREELLAQIDRLRAELRRSHTELREVQEELSRKEQLAVVGELAAAVAHEVRNPLAVIVNACAGLKRADLGPDDRAVLVDIVEEETVRLNRLVTDLLRFARPVKLQRARVSLTELVRHCFVPDTHELVVDVRADDPGAHLVGDASLLRVAIDGLVQNACLAMPDGGVVRVEVDDGPGHSLVVEIIDEGHGMDPQVLSRARDPFFTTRPSGTGLGLPIVQRIVEAHGGSLELDSVAGDGTTARVRFPGASREAPSARPAAEARGS